MEFRFIEQTDIAALAALRLDYLRETTRRDIPAEFLPNTLHYLETGFAEGTLAGMVAVEAGAIVVHGMMAVFDIMPTLHNPAGKRSSLFNFYTRQEWRRRHIATEILRRLINEARKLGVRDIFLNAREIAISLYEQAGFEFLHHEMRLEL